MLILAALLAAASGPACVRDGNQMQLDLCAQQDFAQADGALNGQWRLTIGRLSGSAADKLRQAQRSWLVFRDAECMAEAAPSEGGSIYGMELLSCRTRVTQARTRELAALAVRR